MSGTANAVRGEGWSSQRGKNRDAAAANGWLKDGSTEPKSEVVGHR